MALPMGRWRCFVVLLWPMAVFGCGARTTLSPTEQSQVDFVTAGGAQAAGGNDSAQGGYGLASTSGVAQGGDVAIGESGTTVDPPPICVIEGRTFRNHEANPVNSCQSCQILVSRKSWSLEPSCVTAGAAAN